jgi:hypothetical protein
MGKTSSEMLVKFVWFSGIVLSEGVVEHRLESRTANHSTYLKAGLGTTWRFGSISQGG